MMLMFCYGLCYETTTYESNTEKALTTVDIYGFSRSIIPYLLNTSTFFFYLGTCSAMKILLIL